MYKLGRYALLTVAVPLIAFLAPVFAKDADEVTEHLNKAAEALREVVSAQGEGRLADAISESRCIAVVPSLTEAALVAGGKHGHGVVTCKTSPNKWSAPAFFSISGASVGAQIGVQQKTLLILAMNDVGKNKFMQGEFSFDATAEATAEATAGSRSTDKSWGDQSLVTFEVSKGLFAGVNVRDTTIRRDDDVMDAMYGSQTKTDQVLAGKVAMPITAQPFIDEIQKVEAR